MVWSLLHCRWSIISISHYGHSSITLIIGLHHCSWYTNKQPYTFRTISIFTEYTIMWPYWAVELKNGCVCLCSEDDFPPKGVDLDAYSFWRYLGQVGTSRWQIKVQGHRRKMFFFRSESESIHWTIGHWSCSGNATEKWTWIGNCK